jgi:tyrosyl-tRNA synthetase
VIEGMCKSGMEAKRLVTQGGVYINGDRVGTWDRMVTVDDFTDDKLMLRVGKKRYLRVKLV